MRRGESDTFHWTQNKKKQNKTKQKKKDINNKKEKKTEKRQNQEYRICLHPVPRQETEILSPGILFLKLTAAVQCK